MTLDNIPGPKVFAQRDVRETSNITRIPTIGDYTNAQHDHSSADSGGTTADVNSVAAGAGIDVSAATGAVTISAEDSTAGNKGIVIVAGGEGMDVSYASGTATVAGEDASTSNKGIAQFAAADFNTSSGVINLDDTVPQAFDGDSGTATPTSNNIDILGTANEITTVGSGNDITISLANKTSYVSIPASAFHTLAPDIADVYTGLSQAYPQSGSYSFNAPIQIPHGAVITAAIVYGTGAENWGLYRIQNNGTGGGQLAGAQLGVEDSSIDTATVDNDTYTYAFDTESLDFADSDQIWGAKITYTTDYD